MDMQQTGVNMRSLKSGPVILAMAAMLGGCMGEFGDEWAGEPGVDDEASIPDDEKEPIVDKTYLGDLGVALGSPVATGNTGGLSNEYHPTCVSNSAAPEAAYTWTAPSTGSFVFDTIGSGFDTVLEIRRYSDSLSLGCNDDSSGLQSRVTVSLPAGQTVLVAIDGYGSSTGTYRLNITGGGGGTIPSGTHLWLRADAEVSAPGGRVAEWRDQSGNGRHGYMPTLSRQPFLVNGALNGRPVVRFSGAQSLILSIYAQPTVFTVFVVGKNSKTSESYSMILGPAGNSPNNQLRWENGSQALFVGLGNNMPIITTSVGNTRTYHALSARYNGSSMSVYRDGNQVSSHSFTTSGPWTLAAVGAWFSSYFMVGDLAEVIIYDRVLSDTDRNAVNAYLRSKYGLP
jgi:Concanavalin A-like lectin/glucanases superfamily